MHCVDLGESFPTHILLQNLASIQPLTSPVKFVRSPRTDPPRLDSFRTGHGPGPRRGGGGRPAGGARAAAGAGTHLRLLGVLRLRQGEED